MQRHFRKAMLMLAVCSTVLFRAANRSSQTLERYVGDHRFVGVPGVPNPFVGTFVRASTGVATTLGLQVEYLHFDDPPELIGIRENDLKFLIQEFEFQQKFGSRWAARLAASGSGRMGTDTATLLSEGISGIVGWNIGGTYQLSEKENFKLAVSRGCELQFAYRHRDRRLHPGCDRDRLERHDEHPGQHAIEPAHHRRRAGRLGEEHLVRLRTLRGPGRQEPYDPEDDTQVFWQAGGVVSWDMREKWRPGPRVHAGHAYRSRSSRNEDIGSGGLNSSFTIAYTGRPDFNVGLQTSYQRLKQLEVDNRVGTLGFNFFLRFDFS
jgi:hypothetical protein